MKRHGDNPNLSAPPIPAAKFAQPITELVNGTFWVPQVRLVFGEKSSQFAAPDENFEEP
jgi:hypothetical protein